MTEIENKIPEAIYRAVGFELTAKGLESLGGDWVDFAQSCQNFANSIKKQTLSLGMDEQFWEEARKTLLQEREDNATDWLELNFFPSVSDDNNSTSTTESSTSTVNSINSETEFQSSFIGEVQTLNSEGQQLREKESESEIEDVDETENVDDDPLQQDLIRRAVPILFKALERYGTVSEAGQSIVLEGERNSIRWSIPHRKLTVSGEEELNIEFDSDKQVSSYRSKLSSEYVEHLENQVATQLESPPPTRIITRNLDR
ncbi:MAG: hypothetical protein VKK42_20185 [Lyngbya sp.]|nr:hypothetical protein [Lyngbya sp.]